MWDAGGSPGRKVRVFRPRPHITAYFLAPPARTPGPRAPQTPQYPCPSLRSLRAPPSPPCPRPSATAAPPPVTEPPSPARGPGRVPPPPGQRSQAPRGAQPPTRLGELCQRLRRKHLRPRTVGPDSSPRESIVFFVAFYYYLFGQAGPWPEARRTSLSWAGGRSAGAGRGRGAWTAEIRRARG